MNDDLICFRKEFPTHFVRLNIFIQRTFHFYSIVKKSYSAKYSHAEVQNKSGWLSIKDSDDTKEKNPIFNTSFNLKLWMLLVLKPNT